MEKKEYLECEKLWVFRVLIFVAGFYGSYTLTIRGGVFCNAQTANMALLAMALGNGNWSKAAYYLIPLGAYLLGTVVSEILPKTVRRLHVVRWDTALMLLEILAVVIVGFIPATAPHQISQIIIIVICAMQSNTFRAAEGITMASTFCTVHFRQFGVNLTRMLCKSPGHPEAARNTAAHGLMLACFIAGAFAAAVLCRWVSVKAIWFVTVPLAVLFADLLHADLTKEKQLLEVTPHGH